MNGFDVEPMTLAAVFGYKGSPGNVGGFGLFRPDGRQRLEVFVLDAVEIVERVESRRSDASGIIGNVTRTTSGAAKVHRLFMIMRIARLKPIPTAAQILPFSRRLLVSFFCVILS